MTTKKSVISFVELKGLLHSISDTRPDIGIRLRLMGEMWGQNFLCIESINDHRILLKDTFSSGTVVIRNLNDVIQFELETSFHGYDAYCHYWITEIPAFREAVK